MFVSLTKDCGPDGAGDMERRERQNRESPKIATQNVWTLDRCSGSGWLGVEGILGSPRSPKLVNSKCADGAEYKVPCIAVDAEFS